MFQKYKNNTEFKEENGYDIDGVWYPRVTKIVGIKNKPGLHYFYASVKNYKEAERIAEKSAEEGTLVHDTIEEIFRGGRPDVDPTIKPSIDAFNIFQEQKGIQVVEEYIEHRVVNPEYRYAGTMDAMALIDGKLGVLDIKTSTGIYRDYDLQTAAYIGGLKETVPELQTRWILRVDQVNHCQNCGATQRHKGGRVKVRWPKRGYPCRNHDWGPLKGVVELKESPYWKDDFAAFLSAKQLWEWENKDWLQKIKYL